MSETIREVIVKLKIQMDRQKIIAPDISDALSGAKQLESQYNSVFAAAKRAAQAGMSIPAQMAAKGQIQSGANNGVNSALDARSQLLAKAAAQEKAYADKAAKYDEQMAARREAAANKLKQQAEKELAEKNTWLAKAAAQAEKQAAADAKRIEKAELAAQRHAEKLAAIAKAGQSTPVAAATAAAAKPAEVAKSPVNSAEAYTRAGDAYKSAGEGAFTLARGLVLLTSANEKDLAVMVQRLAIYQGGFDVLKGTYEVGKGVATGTKLLAIAHSSAAVAAAIQAGTVGGLTISLIAAKAAAIGFWTALTGPVGLAILGTTAALGVGYLAWNRYSGATEAAAAKAKAAADKEIAAMRDRMVALRELSAAQIQANAIQGQFDYAGQIRGLTDANQSFLDRITAVQKDSQSDRERSISELTRGANFAEGRKPEKGTVFDPSYMKEQVDSAGNYLEALKRIRQESSARSFVQLQMGKNDKSVLSLKTEEERAKAINDIHEKDNATLNTHGALYEKLIQANERQLSLGREKLKLLGDEETRLKAIKSAHDMNAKAVSDARKALAAANMSDIQKFAQLDPLQQEQIRNISDRVDKAGGDLEKAGLAKHEIDFLRQTGLSEANVQRYDLNRGIAGGANDILKKLGSQNVTATEAALGKGQEGDSRGDVLDFQQQRADAGRKEINQTLSKIEAERKKENEEQIAGLKELANTRKISDVIKEAMKIRDAEIEKLRTDLAQQKNAVSANEQASFRGDFGSRQF